MKINIKKEYMPQKIQESWPKFKIMDDIILDLDTLKKLAIENIEQTLKKQEAIMQDMKKDNEEKQKRKAALATRQRANYVQELQNQRKKDLLTPKEALYYQIREMLKIKNKSYVKSENIYDISNSFLND